MKLEQVLKSQQLPTLPTIAIRLLELTRDPDSEIRDFVDTVKSDPALSAKILKSANSSYFGLSSSVTTVDRAIVLLGTTVATSLSLSFSLSDEAMSSGPLAEHYRDYWMQSIVQSASAEALEEVGFKGLGADLFLCGLLLDLGRLALLKAVGRAYTPILDEAKTGPAVLVDIESRVLGYSHVDVGDHLMKSWKLPQSFIEAVRCHHLPASVILRKHQEANDGLCLPAAVAARAGDYFCTPAKGEALAELRELMGGAYNFTEAQITDFLARVDTRIKQAAELFNFDMSSLGEPTDLMEQANAQLAELAMREHVAKTQADARQQIIEQQKQELETRNRELQSQVLHDALTGLHNRKFFDQTLEQEVSKSIRAANAVAVLFLDIDRFKSLNDTYGHQFGDLVLARVAANLKSNLRVADMAARYGGEEFVVIVHQPTEKGIERLAERLRAGVESLEVEHNGSRVPVTISIGGAIAVPTRVDKDLARSLVAAADESLYQSKGNGRNRCTIRSLLNERDRKLVHDTTNHRFSRWLVQQRLMDVPTASRVIAETSHPHRPIGELAWESGFLTDGDVDEILRIQRETSRRFGEIAIDRGVLNYPQLVYLLSRQQEDPRAIAATIARLGVASPDQAAALLERYRQFTETNLAIHQTESAAR